MSAAPVNNSIRCDFPTSMHFLLLKHGGYYHTAGIAYPSKEFVDLLLHPSDGAELHAVVVTVGEHRFIVISNQTYFLLDSQKKSARDFVKEVTVLDLYPSGEVPENVGGERSLEVPTLWDEAVEPMLDFAIGEQPLVRKNGIWFPADLPTEGGAVL